LNSKQNSLLKTKWDVWLASVPFADNTDNKVRPVIIRDDRVFIVECYEITSRPVREAEYKLQQWALAGLTKTSAVKLFPIELLSSMFIHRIGSLHLSDRRKLIALTESDNI
jgi:hypothetical protein